MCNGDLLFQKYPRPKLETKTKLNPKIICILPPNTLMLVECLKYPHASFNFYCIKEIKIFGAREDRSLTVDLPFSRITKVEICFVIFTKVEN